MVASKEQSERASKIHALITKYWAFTGWSAQKISDEFTRDELLHKEFGSVSVSSVLDHIKKIRIEFETLVDEDVLEKYTSEFVRKQFQYDHQIEEIMKMSNTIDVEDLKGKELWLKFEAMKSQILDKQIKMMTDIELVLMTKQMNAKRRGEIKTLKVVPSKALESRVVEDIDNLVDLTAPLERLEKSEVRLSDAKRKLKEAEQELEDKGVDIANR